MQISTSEQLSIDCVLQSNCLGAGVIVCVTSVCVARQDQADGAHEFSGHGGDAVQRIAGLESIEGQLGQVHVSAVVISRAGRFGHYDHAAKNGHELYLDVVYLSCDVLHISIARRG